MDPEFSKLSIIIPALNEAATLPYLLQDLSWQKNIRLEVIIVDGGSSDQTVELCRNFAKSASYSITIIHSEAGRAKQLNKGEAASSSDELLFLHADTRLRHASLLQNAKRYLDKKRSQDKNPNLTGHFPITFASSPGHKNNYYFYECKTFLNKPDCINGDQGYWISKSYFQSLGKFDESLPYMEDARIARKILHDNNWITLPGTIETSARRFETEGYSKRQILNSFLCNFNAMEEQAYFELVDNIYQQQQEATQLSLRPFLKSTHQFINQDGVKTALRRWYRTGSYIANNAWQLAFAWDCKKNKKQGLHPSAEDAGTLEFYDKHLAKIASWPAIRALTSIVTIVWFYSLFLLR